VPDLSALAGFAIGLAFGGLGLLTGFCLLSGLRDWWNDNDGRKLRSFALALAVAIAGTQALAVTGTVEIGKSLYLQPTFSAPLIFVGGLLFGLGMVLSNGCAARALVLLGKGNLRSLVVIALIGITAQMTLKGLLGPARLAFMQWTQVSPDAVSVPALLSMLGLSDLAARVLATGAISGGLAIFAFSDATFRRSLSAVIAGLGVGALVVAGWAATGWFAVDEFNPIPVTSLTFVAPLSDSLQYVMLSTGLSLSFGVAVVFGVLAGSFTVALLTGRFQLEGYTSAPHMLRSVSGAMLMGIGGAMAYGCSVGQGLTGLSTLALPSFVAAAGILSGAAIGLRGQAVVPALAAR
jgi:uncharacterized membrane protein YedE/YeeE